MVVPSRQRCAHPPQRARQFPAVHGENVYYIPRRFSLANSQAQPRPSFFFDVPCKNVNVIARIKRGNGKGRPTFINHPEEEKKFCSRYIRLNYPFASIEKQRH